MIVNAPIFPRIWKPTRIENDRTLLHINYRVINCDCSCGSVRHLLSKTKRIANVVLTIAGVLQTIPTLAVLAIMIPIFGVGKTPAIVALFIYVLLPILNNTVLGVQNIDKNIIKLAQVWV